MVSKVTQEQYCRAGESVNRKVKTGETRELTAGESQISVGSAHQINRFNRTARSVTAPAGGARDASEISCFSVLHVLCGCSSGTADDGAAFFVCAVAGRNSGGSDAGREGGAGRGIQLCSGRERGRGAVRRVYDPDDGEGCGRGAGGTGDRAERVHGGGVGGAEYVSVELGSGGGPGTGSAGGILLRHRCVWAFRAGDIDQRALATTGVEGDAAAEEVDAYRGDL